ncbi:MAG TPA: hypothetical protein DEQ47_13945 [Solibacterales bacterium]|nr:hypothetical protein [Bryobacterales bacterium]
MSNAVVDDSVSGNLSLEIVFRECAEEGGFVAECLDIPGCLSQGETIEEAETNIRDAIQACLSVMFEDCLKIAGQRHEPPNFVGISRQQSLSVVPPHLLTSAEA